MVDPKRLASRLKASGSPSTAVRTRRHPWQGRDWRWGVALAVLAAIASFTAASLYSPMTTYPPYKNIPGVINIQLSSYPMDVGIDIRFYDSIDRGGLRVGKSWNLLDNTSEFPKSLTYMAIFVHVNPMQDAPVEAIIDVDDMSKGEIYVKNDLDMDVSEARLALGNWPNNGDWAPVGDARFTAAAVIAQVGPFATETSGASAVQVPPVSVSSTRGPRGELGGSFDVPFYADVVIADDAPDTEVVRSRPTLRRSNGSLHWSFTEKENFRGEALLVNGESRGQRENHLFFSGIIGGIAGSLWVELLLFLAPRARQTD